MNEKVFEYKLTTYKPAGYHVWLTVLTKSYENLIVSSLIEKGYSVSSASGTSTTLTHENSPSAIIALRIEKHGFDLTPSELYSSLDEVLFELKIQFFSIIISEYSMQCKWFGSNITIPVQNIKSDNRKMN